MGKPLDDDFNFNTTSAIIEGGISLATPKQAKIVAFDPTDIGIINTPSAITENSLATPKMAKGGVFAAADIGLIKEALHCFIQTKGDELPTAKERQIVNLLHRLNNRI